MVVSGVLYLVALCVVGVLVFSYMVAYRMSRSPMVLAELLFFISVWFLIAVGAMAVVREIFQAEHLFVPWPWTRPTFLSLSGLFLLKEVWRHNSTLICEEDENS